MNVILSVDDEPKIIRVRRLLLQQAGHDVLDASNGEEALRILENSNVDLIILDFYMPGLDGGAVACEMKGRRPDIPVIMMSASEDCLEHARAYVDGFVFKGAGPKHLLLEINRLLVPAHQAQNRTGR
jgi:CheY-like chemotaxis protein